MLVWTVKTNGDDAVPARVAVSPTPISGEMAALVNHRPGARRGAAAVRHHILTT